MALNNILVAIDFSEPSEVALSQAIAVAERAGAALVLLWVAGEGIEAPDGAAIYGTAVPEVEQLIAGMRAESMARLEALARRARSRGVTATVRVEPGDPAQVIVALAEELGADMIVTGTKGITGVKRFFLGSVATKVVRTSRANVLVARGQSGAFGRVLVPTDFSPASEEALRLALELCAPKAAVTLFHAWQYPPDTLGVVTPNPTEGPLVKLRDDIVSRSEARAQAWMKKYGAGRASIDFVLEYGAAAGTIQDMLHAASYDLVAMGTHGYRGFQRVLLGSVAEATVRHAPCSVLVAHAGDAG